MAGTIAADGELVEHPAGMRLHGILAHVESSGNFAIAQSRSQRLENFEFSRRDAAVGPAAKSPFRQWQDAPGFNSTIKLWIGVLPKFSTECVMGGFQYASPALRWLIRWVPSLSLIRALKALSV